MPAEIIPVCITLSLLLLNCSDKYVLHRFRFFYLLALLVCMSNAVFQEMNLLESIKRNKNSLVNVLMWLFEQRLENISLYKLNVLLTVHHTTTV
jgi:hypothetical protein